MSSDKVPEVLKRNILFIFLKTELTELNSSFTLYFGKQTLYVLLAYILLDSSKYSDNTKCVDVFINQL